MGKFDLGAANLDLADSLLLLRDLRRLRRDQLAVRHHKISMAGFDRSTQKLLYGRYVGTIQRTLNEDLKLGGYAKVVDVRIDGEH